MMTKAAGTALSAEHVLLHLIPTKALRTQSEYLLFSTEK